MLTISSNNNWTVEKALLDNISCYMNSDLNNLIKYSIKIRGKITDHIYLIIKVSKTARLVYNGQVE